MHENRLWAKVCSNYYQIEIPSENGFAKLFYKNGTLRVLGNKLNHIKLKNLFYSFTQIWKSSGFLDSRLAREAFLSSYIWTFTSHPGLFPSHHLFMSLPLKFIKLTNTFSTEMVSCLVRTFRFVDLHPTGLIRFDRKRFSRFTWTRKTVARQPSNAVSAQLLHKQSWS